MPTLFDVDDRDVDSGLWNVIGRFDTPEPP